VLDLVAGVPAHVHGAAATIRHDEVVDYAVATVVFENGPIATFGASRATEERIRRMSISALDVHVTVDLAARALETCRTTNLRELGNAGVRHQSIVERIFVPSEEPLLLQAADFLDACWRRRPPAVGLDTAVRCLEVVDAVRDVAFGRALEAVPLAS
jgi:predicted dehydrogenase